MNIYLTLDYEPYLQKPGDDIYTTLIFPTNKFHDILFKYNCKSILFVDAGFLIALDRQKNQYTKISNDFNLIQAQLLHLISQGHEIGLHIHPHWEDCYFDGSIWNMNLKKYKLADFSKKNAADLFLKYFHFLSNILPSTKIISFRAGGWCLEPFNYIRDAMIECGIFIDSSVFFGGYKKNKTHNYDYRNYPSKDIWKFSVDPSMEDVNGSFIEIPFTTNRIYPTVYWRMFFKKIFDTLDNKNNGFGVQPTLYEVFEKLFLSSIHAVSMDSFKSTLLIPTLKSSLENKRNNFCIIGHPKCFTDLTYINLDFFLEYAIASGNTINTFSQLNK